MAPASPTPPPKVRARAWSVGEAVDGAAFVLATALVVWFAVLLLRDEVRLSAGAVVPLVLFWLLAAYVALPRVQQLMARIYVPDYFIGRTTTTSGILGDPVNLALDGDPAQLHAAMARAGWTRADPITLRSSWGIVRSAVLRRSYPSAPVSPLLLFGRAEAFAYEQQVGGNASQRHHVRFWPTPEGWRLPGGHRVGWLAAGTFDRAVGLSLFTLQVTHKVDADIDVERDHVVATLAAAVPEARVTPLEDFVTAFHTRHGGGDVVRTDGALVVVALTAVPAPALAQALRDGPGADGSVAARHLPPPPLLLAGTLGAAKGVAGLAAAAPLALVSLATLVLWAAVLGRRAWARTALMALCAVEATAGLLAVSTTAGRPDLAVLLEAGVAVLILVVVSSDEARAWVARRRTMAPTGASAASARPG